MDGGDTLTQEDNMHQVVLDYFQNVFGERNVDMPLVEENVASVHTDDQNNKLVVELSFEEFSMAVK